MQQEYQLQTKPVKEIILDDLYAKKVKEYYNLDSSKFEHDELFVQFQQEVREIANVYRKYPDTKNCLILVRKLIQNSTYSDELKSILLYNLHAITYNLIVNYLIILVKNINDDWFDKNNFAKRYQASKIKLDKKLAKIRTKLQNNKRTNVEWILFGLINKVCLCAGLSIGDIVSIHKIYGF
ncbi:hypothetical protein ACJA23_01325 [Mycoplasma corogypsi]|uniref:hypothetical protein n=1 Tax=Mycoplasma corogypsi TaxID=2106 RepID=UPI00387396A1